MFLIRLVTTICEEQAGMKSGKIDVQSIDIWDSNVNATDNSINKARLIPYDGVEATEVVTNGTEITVRLNTPTDVTAITIKVSNINSVQIKCIDSTGTPKTIDVNGLIAKVSTPVIMIILNSQQSPNHRELYSLLEFDVYEVQIVV